MKSSALCIQNKIQSAIWRIIFGAPLLVMCVIPAHAQLFSCARADEKVLRNYPCEPGEKQREIKIERPRSYLKINLTGEIAYWSPPDEKRAVISRSPAAPQSIEDRAIAAAHRAAASQARPGDSQDVYNSHFKNALSAFTDLAKMQQLKDWVDFGGHPDNKTARAIAAMGGMNDTNNDAEDEPQPHHNHLIPMSPPTPSIITNCDSGGCWDNLGGRYNGGAGGTYFKSSGGICQDIGGMLQCH